MRSDSLHVSNGWGAVLPGWADLDTSSSLHNEETSFLKQKQKQMIQSQHCQPKFRPLPVWCLQHIYMANSSVLQTVYMWLLRPRHVCPAEIFNGPLRVQSKFSLVCGLQRITEKKDKWACDPMQKSLVFPSGLHICASGISVSFLTAVSSEQSFPPLYPYLLSHSDFYPPNMHCCQMLLCVWSCCTLHLMPSRSCGPLVII